MRGAVLGLAVLLWSMAGGLGAPERAAAAVVIESTSVENGYPRALTFRVTARADVEIVDATLHYAIKGRGTLALDKPRDLSPARTLTAEVELLVNTGQSYIPVGSEFTYFWEVKTADGQVARSEEGYFLYLPPNREWKSVGNDFMVVFFHGDRETLARAYLDAGTETYRRVGRELYGIELATLPVKVILFATEAEMDPARPGAGGRFDAAVTTCGTKVTNDILLMIPTPCGTNDRTDTLRHELGHILNEVAGEGTLAKLPAWLDEGAAVYAQSSPGDYELAFRAAVRADRLIPFSQMVVPTSNPQLVGVFYGQAFFMVKFLIEREGPGRFAELMRAIKSGKRYDVAIEEVYGLSLRAFEDAFRAAYGLGSRATPTVVPTRPAQQAVPTVVPTRAGAAQGAGGGDGGGGVDRGLLVIFGLAVLLALAAAFAWLLAMMLANGRRGGERGSSGGDGSAGEGG